MHIYLGDLDCTSNICNLVTFEEALQYFFSSSASFEGDSLFRRPDFCQNIANNPPRLRFIKLHVTILAPVNCLIYPFRSDLYIMNEDCSLFGKSSMDIEKYRFGFSNFHTIVRWLDCIFVGFELLVHLNSWWHLFAMWFQSVQHFVSQGTNLQQVGLCTRSLWWTWLSS